MLLLNAVAYATLPLWAGSLLRAHLQSDLSEQMGVDVRVGEVRLSWSDGVEIQGLQVAQPEGFGDEPMVRIDRLFCDFSPLRTLFRQRLQWMELEGLRVEIRADEQGRLNVMPLGDLEWDVQAGRVSLRDATVQLYLQGQPEPVPMRVADMQLLNGHNGELGQITMSASIPLRHGRVPVTLRVGGRSGGGAEADLFFQALELADLPLPGEAWPPGSLEGRCRGEFSFRMDESGKVDQLGLAVTADGLVVRPRGGPPLPRIEQAGLYLDAAVDAITGKVDVSSARLRLPGVDLRGSAELYAFLTDPEEWQIDLDVQSLDLRGTVRPQTLLALWREDSEDSGNWSVEGPIEGSLRIDRSPERTSFVLDFDGEKLKLAHAGAVLKPAGQSLDLSCRGIYRPRLTTLEIPEFRAVFGSCRVNASADVSQIRLLRQSWEDHGDPIRLIWEALPHLRSSGRFYLGDLENLQCWLAPHETPVASHGSLSGTWNLQREPLSRLSLSLRTLIGEELSVGTYFVKPPQRNLTLDAVATCSAPNRRLEAGTMDLSTEDGWVSLEEITLAMPDEGRDGFFRCRAQAAGLGALLEMFPELQRHLRAEGNAQGRIELQLTPGGAIRLAGDLTDTGIEAGRAYQKPRGRELRFELDARQETEDSPRLLFDIAQENMHAEGQLHLLSPTGAELEMSGQLTFAALAECCPWFAEETAAFDPRGRTTFRLKASDTPRRRELIMLLDSPDMRLGGGEDADKWTFQWQGPLELTARQKLDTRPTTVEAGLDAGRAAWRLDTAQWGTLKKTSQLAGKLALSVNLDDPSVPQLLDAHLQLGDLHLLADARTRRTEEGILELTEAHASAWTLRADELRRIIPALEPYRLEGDVFADVQISAESDEPIADVTLHSRTLRGEYRGRPCRLEGKVFLDRCRWDETGRFVGVEGFHTDKLALRLGPAEGWLIADIDSPLSNPTGRFDLLLSKLDDKALLDWLGNEADASGPSSLSPLEMTRLEDRVDGWIAAAGNRLRRADLSGDVWIDRYRMYDRNVDEQYELAGFRLRAEADHGDLRLAYSGGLSGGIVSGTYTTRLIGEDPMVFRNSDVREVVATPGIQPQIEQFFPGNKVTGLFSREEEVRFPLRELLANAVDPRYRLLPVGEAKMTATEGVVTGRAAPRFVTRIFPGLNLARYHYDRMTAFTVFRPDGIAINETLFSGTYDVYMEGQTDAHNRVKYTLGLVLLGTAISPEWHHEWKQGRIPILKVEGQIDNGKLVDEEVSYPWPNESLGEVLIRNNVIYRAWLNLREKPADGPPSSPNP